MELYSKEFWKACLAIHSTGAKLDANLESRLLAHKGSIQAFCDGAPLEYREHSSVEWCRVATPTCSFYPKVTFRVAPPPNMERDVVVFYRSTHQQGYFKVPAGIDVRVLLPAGTNAEAETLTDLEFTIAGFKLLSITRVVIDPTNRNLLEYSTKIDNLARVPF